MNDTNIISAAKWLGASLVVSSLILVIGLHLSAEANTRRLSSSISSAGATAASGQRRHQSVTLNTQGQLQVAPVQVQFRPVAGAASAGLRVEPLTVRIVDGTATTRPADTE